MPFPSIIEGFDRRGKGMAGVTPRFNGQRGLLLIAVTFTHLYTPTILIHHIHPLNLTITPTYRYYRTLQPISTSNSPPGIVVAQTHADTLRDAWQHRQMQREREAERKRRVRVWSRWEVMVRGVLVAESVRKTMERYA